MTLRQPNIERMLQLKLSGMVEALEEQRDIADIDQLGFDDRLAMMLEREVAHRDQKSYLNNLRQAQLRIRADIQDVDCSAGRGVARGTLTQLAAGDWIRQAVNLIVEGPTGSGKTFLSCALAHQACRQKQSVLYRRVPELISALNHTRDDDEKHTRVMRRLATVSLLVLDDWGLQGFCAEGRRDLLEIVEHRYGRKSILIASQIPMEHWPAVVGKPTIADAILDRIVHNAYRIELAGESQRKRHTPPPLGGSGT
ncbi:IS21-like element helper ATPase IstB [Hoeflea sp.]|uniref:IS21-like element helper ATPase IstB n=1 Tax=Hoeflea sp. TaxID=1940281 RepID=UPI003B02BF56